MNTRPGTSPQCQTGSLEIALESAFTKLAQSMHGTFSADNKQQLSILATLLIEIESILVKFELLIT